MEGKINQTESKINKTKKYHTILADPPWGVSSQRGKNSHRSAESHYELMSLERIKAMPVQDLAEENSHLYLWIPNALLQEGLDVIKANWIFCPQQRHSQKPEEQYAVIRRMSYGPYLELFARHREPGWDIWGNEAPGGSDIIMPGDYPVPKYSAKALREEG